MNGPMSWHPKDSPGVIWLYPKPQPPDTNWLLCDGSAYDPNAYPELYTVLGTADLPNLTDQAPRGAWYIISTGPETTETA
jgi:Phage Tail Collar Domain